MTFTKEQAIEDFNTNVKSHIVEQFGKDDKIALVCGWNDYTNMLLDDGMITVKQYETWSNPFEFRRY